MSDAHNRPNQTHQTNWLSLSAGLFALLMVTALLLVMALNGSVVNHVFSPLEEVLPMFRLVWGDNPPGALAFLANKSLFAFAHLDAHSGLNHWTLQFDALSLIGYAVAALLGGRVIAYGGRQDGRGLALLLAALTGLVFSVTYASNIAHCAGPTWVGFVTLYGLGFFGFETPIYWQWLLAVPSLAGLIYQARKTPAETVSDRPAGAPAARK